MKVIAAVVVGGTAITGGRGTFAGTLLGVVLLGTIGPALTFLGVSAYWERALQGVIILAAVAFDALRDRAGASYPRVAAGARAWRERRFDAGVLLLALAGEIAFFSLDRAELS